MANKDVSIVFKASDRLSESVKGMRSNVKGLQADVNAYKKVQNEVFSEKAKVKLDIRDAKASIKELEKEIKKGSEGAREAYLEQQKTLEGLQAEYRKLAEVQKDAAKAEKELSNAFSKSSNAMGNGIGCLPMILAAAGPLKMLGSSIGDYMGHEVSSMFGSGIGDAVGNIASGTLTGAALGATAGAPGALIGGLVGGASGIIQSVTEKDTALDDAFRSEVQNLHSDAITDMENRITTGSGIAAERETYQKGFESVLGKELGSELFAQLKAYGDTTAYDTTAMLGKGKEMLAYGIAGEDIMEMTQIIGDIAGGSTNNFSGLAYAISQSMAAGRLNAQDKNQMINYGFNPLEFIAKLQGISVADATNMMSKGQISSDMLMDALRLAVSEGERFHGNANAMSGTYSGMEGQLDSAWNDINAAAGAGFNEKRKEGMAAELDALNGELGEKMRTAYEMAGAYEAELENQHQQMLLKAMEDATKRIEEQGLTGIEAEKAIWEAKTQAEIDYKNSEEYMMKMEAERSMVDKIQQALTDERTYVDFGYEMSQQFTEGFQDGVLATMKNEGFWAGINGIFAKSYQGTPGGANGHATGLQYVPYDGYIAKLHEGERVLTRLEARQGTGKSISIAKLADQIIVREEADIDKISRALVAKLMDAEENYVGV